MRNDTLCRVLRLLQQMQDGCRHTLHGLADRHGVTTRTIRRDIEALQSVGFEICRVFDEVDGRFTFYMLPRPGSRRTESHDIGEMHV